MKDIRKQTNKSNQNSSLYKVFTLYKPCKSWNKPADLYVARVIRFGSYVSGRARFEITENRQHHIAQMGIVILDETIRHIFQKIDWDCYKCKGIGSFYQTKETIHAAFNDIYKKINIFV